VALDQSPEELTGAAATQFGVLDAMDVSIKVASEQSFVYSTAPVVVDALVGYGLTGTLRGTARTIVEDVNASDADVVSLDLPSGLDATTGERLGPAVAPDEVVTLALPKTGLIECTCPVRLLDIGIPAVVFERVGVEYTQPFGDADSIAISYNPDL
jgi:NAD(P)H-hydrate epimerase